MRDYFIRMVSETGSDEYNQAGANEVAWQHAVSLAKASDIELGSDEFVKMYNALDERYQFCGQHHGYLHHIAGRMLHAILETPHVNIVVDNSSDNGDNVMQVINLCTEIIISGFMWAYASKDISWVSNEEWRQLDEELRSVYFVLGGPDHECDIEGESHDHD